MLEMNYFNFEHELQMWFGSLFFLIHSYKCLVLKIDFWVVFFLF